MNKTIYLDMAATTPITKPVLEAMFPYLTENYGNPSSLYSLGTKAKVGIENARKQIAKAINAKSEQIIFTSGATEANNWICSSFNRVICSPFEHHSVLNNPHILFKTSPSMSLCVLFEQIPEYEQFMPDLYSHMFVNNEIGEIYDIKTIAKICHKYNILFHSDGTQAFSHIPIDVVDLDVDFLSLSGHKFHSPKGVGILYIKEPDKFKPFLYGGAQEKELRAGTENVASIVGMGKAMELYNYSPERDNRCKEIQNKFYNAFLQMTDVHFNTDIGHSISSTLNVGFKGIESESLMLLLDMDGICVSAGSACNSGSLEPSHVLKAINCPEEYIYNSIRLSWDDTLTNEDVNYTIERIMNNVKKVRGYI